MKKIIFFTISILFLIVIVNLSKSIYELYHKKDLLLATEKKLSQDEKENQDLKNKLTEVQNPAFIEGEARDKLFMAKPGESSILLPTVQPTEKTEKTEEKPHWQEWWELFFGQ